MSYQKCNQISINDEFQSLILDICISICQNRDCEQDEFDALCDAIVEYQKKSSYPDLHISVTMMLQYVYHNILLETASVSISNSNRMIIESIIHTNVMQELNLMLNGNTGDDINTNKNNSSYHLYEDVSRQRMVDYNKMALTPNKMQPYETIEELLNDTIVQSKFSETRLRFKM